MFDLPYLGPYVAALRGLPVPGRRALLMGPLAGPLAVAACRLGAARATVLGEPESLRTLVDLARANGCDDRLEPLGNRPDRVDLPEPVDLLVASFDAGALPHGDPFDDLRLARDRFLAPGGHLVPRRATTWLLPVAAPARHGSISLEAEERLLEVDLSPLRRLRFNRPVPVDPDEVSSPWEPRPVQVLDLREGAVSGLDHRSEWAAPTPTTVHGLAAWTEWELDEGLVVGPARRTLFPAGRSLEVQPGDRLRLVLQATPSREGTVWSWGGDLGSARFRQCSLFGEPRRLAALMPSPEEQYA